ncbi:MAG: DUF4394 domain-containing protein, partial [Pirellulaceae bacterium]|nr:DUF4394 domain-containing protein [Pirellulaceae bacterium]
MFIRPFNALAARSARRRQWFLNQLWTSIVGAETPANYRLRRFGQMESLEGRRVLATMYAATDSNQLLTFDSATPGTISNSVAITGLVAGERVVGIDTRPATGQLYAFGLVDDGATRTGRIYTLDPITGVASQVGNAPWSTTLNDTQFVGFNFNPNVDRIRIVDRQGANFRVHPDTGALAGTDTNLSVAGINGVAYTNNDGARSTTTLYGLNIDQDALVTIGGIDGVPSPNTGVVNTIGSTGLVALDSYGLEVTSIGGTTTAFASAERKLFSVNLVSGALTSLGTIGGGGVVIQAITAALDSITVAGSAGDDVVVVNATGSNSGSYSLNGGPSIPFANVASFSFIAGAGNDTLTINNPAGGLFAPSRGIDYQGGGQAGDSLNLLGGGSAAFTQTYSVGTRTPPVGNSGNNGDGLIRFAGPTPVDIRFTGLAPIIDTVLAASLTVTATDAANTISLTNGTAASRLQVAVDAFEPIEFTNKGALIVNAGDGVAGGDLGDTINVNYSNVPVGLTNMSINANEGDDVINVQAKAGAGIVVSISGNQGTNTFNFGLAGTLDAILGGSTFLFGNSGADKLNLNDAADGTNNIYTLTNNTFTRSGAGSIGYTNMSQVSLNAGTGSDTINTTSLFLSTQAFINAGGGDDTINATDSGSLSLIQGAMTYAGQAGNDRLNINDSSDGVTRIYTISNNVINRTSAGALNYDNTLETIDLAATNNGNSFLISSTAAGIVYNVNTGVGSDSIGTGNMSAIDGQVNLTTGGGFDQLAVSESSGLSDTFTLTQVGNATELTYGNGDAAIDLRYDATGPTGQLENFVLFASGVAQTVIINNTTANNFTAVQTSDAADTITIDGSGLTANNFITSNLGNDTLTLNVPGIITATALAINAGPANGTSSQRDQVNINDGQAGRSVSFDYANASNGDAVVGGLGTNINLNQVESLVYTGNGAFASVAGTSGTDDLTVASLAGAAMFFLGGNPWDGPTDGAFSSALPGVAGPGAVKGPYILARGLNPFSSVNVSGDGGANDRLYLYASSEMDLLDPANPATPVFRGVGFGNGTLIPGRGVGNAYNNISVSDSAMFIQAGPTALTGVNFNGAQFVQANPLVPGVIVNAGDEAAPGPGGVADNISVSPSAQVLFQINGGDPTASAAPQGDRLRVDFLGSVNAFNNKTPNVTITGSDARGVLSSSIERTLVTTGNGVVNLIGDNNNPAVDQADHFVVVGRDVESAFGEGDTDGANELTASINGVELSFNRVQFLNVFGADLTG